VAPFEQPLSEVRRLSIRLQSSAQAGAPTMDPNDFLRCGYFILQNKTEKCIVMRQAPQVVCCVTVASAWEHARSIYMLMKDSPSRQPEEFAIVRAGYGAAMVAPDSPTNLMIITRLLSPTP
jgi:hypothetical protein